MDTTLTKRTLTGAVVKASSVFQNNKNAYKITIQVEKTGHNLMIGSSVNLNITGLTVYSVDFINDSGISQPITDFFNQQRQFYVVDANTLTCNVDVNSSSFDNVLAVISGTPIVKVNNDRIILPEGNYNFELLNKVDYANLRVFDADYKFRIKELGIGSKQIYNGASDYYSDGTITSISDINEQDLTFKFCKEVEISIVDGSNNNIPNEDYSKTTNIGLIINRL